MTPLLIVGLISFPPAEATTRAEQLLKVVAYDRNLQARTPEGLRLAIVLDPAAPESKSDAAGFQQEVAALTRERSALAPATTETLAFTSEEELSRALVTKKISAIYVAAGLGASLPALVRSAEEAGVMTLAGDPEDVGRGLVAGVLRQGETKKIVVNMAAAERCGVDLDAAVRQVAQRVGPTGSEPERADLAAVLSRYREAIQNKDMAALRSLWPALTEEEAGRVEASMASVRSHQVFLAPLRIENEGSRLRIRVRRTDQLVTRNGEKLVTGRLIEIVFSRSGEGAWVIDSMGAV